MKYTLLLALLMVGCSSAPKSRLIDHRSYWLGCVVGSANYAKPQTQAAADKINQFCNDAEKETRIGVGE